MSIDKIYNLDLKIEVPKTYALADSELRKKLVGKRPIKQLYQTLQDLDGEVYDTLLEEINSQLPEEQKEMLEEMAEKEKMDGHHEEMMEKLDAVVEAVQTIGTPEINFPEPVEIVQVSNLKDIKFPEVKIPAFPEIPKFDDTKIITGLDSVRKAIGEIPAPIAPLDTIKVEKPDWYAPTDLDPTNKAIKLVGDSLGEALETIDNSLHDPKKPVKVQILDKKGNVIEKFGGDAVAVGGGGGGGGLIETYSTFSTGSNLDVDLTAEQLTTASVIANRGVLVKAGDLNSGTVYIGSSNAVTAGTVAATDGFPLTGGESLLVHATNANLIWAIADTVNQKLFFYAV